MSFILPYKSVLPTIDPTAFVAESASIIGDVTIGEGTSIWHGAVVRGDLQPIRIGKYTNIQDNATVHIMGNEPTVIGDYVTVGHNAVVHCRSVGDNTLIGMGAILLGHTEIGENCIIGAGTMLTQNKKIPPNSLVYGNPAQIVRSLRDDELEALRESAMHYHELAQNYINEREKL